MKKTLTFPLHYAKNLWLWLLVIVVIGCNESEIEETESPFVMVSTDLQDNSNYGGFISAEAAAKAHGHWRVENYGRVELDPNQVYGVSFGRKKIEELLSSNKNITGLRFYFTKSIDRINGELVEHDDVVVIPYDANGKDLIDFKSKISPQTAPADHTRTSKNKRTNDEGVLDTSIPCPNQCQ
jgi:hypothetical protein